MQISSQNKIKNFELLQVYLLRCEVEHREKQLNRIGHVISKSSIAELTTVTWFQYVINQLITYQSD